MALGKLSLPLSALASCLVVRARAGAPTRSLRGGGDEDPYLWLENTGNPEVTEWVLGQNRRTLAGLGEVESGRLYHEVLESLETTSKIPAPTAIGDSVYNFWRDADHVRGLWRRTTWRGYAASDVEWETVLDLDGLARAEGKPWVWKGCKFLKRGPSSPFDLCLMQLSSGGGDAVIVREFNTTSKDFVDGGFAVPLAKTEVSYEDEDTVLVGTDFGPESMTTSGYARTVRRWRRGRPLEEAELVFEVQVGDVSARQWRDYNRRGFVCDWRGRVMSFWQVAWEVRPVSPEADDVFRELPVPQTSFVHRFADQLILELKEDFAPPGGAAFISGSVVAAPLAPVLMGEVTEWTTLFTPSANRSVTDVVRTRDGLVLQVLDAVKPQLVVYLFSDVGEWTRAAGQETTEIASVRVRAVDGLGSNRIWLTKQTMLQPATLSVAEVGDGPLELKELKATADKFDSEGLEASQRWTRSKDGTLVPYFLVSHAGDARARPTILYGYGGFGVSLTPRYMSTKGVAWLSKGGAYAIANIRGGGEFGPMWHRNATGEGRHLSFEDFAAVAEDLVATGVTTAGQLGAVGGSNGGLLVGNMLVQYPRLFAAIACDAPLLDMKRYTQLLAGASWIAEYGDPSNATDWEWLRNYSPYHNVDEEVEYPAVLFKTSSADDRVHPGHARKMTERLLVENPASANDTWFFEATEGGHASPTLRQRAFGEALKYRFFGRYLGLDVDGPAS